MIKYGLITRETDDKLRQTCVNIAGCSWFEFHSGKRRHEAVLSRQIYMYFLHVNCQIPMSLIEKQLKYKEGLKSFDHATLVHAVRTINNWRDTNDKKRDLIDFTLNRLGSILWGNDKSIMHVKLFKPYKPKPFEYRLLKPKRINHRTSYV